jgi:hypothetical protein
MDKVIDVAIVGAGPYGLSVAAHLRKLRVEFRIFGGSGRTWPARMPRGLQLDSDGRASNLSDPEMRFTLKQYCREHGLSYADRGEPIELKTFSRYLRAFQQRLVPELERKTVVSVTRVAASFRLRLDDGQMLTARQVVIATGTGAFRESPARPSPRLRLPASQPQPEPGGGVASHFVTDKPLLFHRLPGAWRSRLLRPCLELKASPPSPDAPRVPVSLALLDPEIVMHVRCADQAPVLSSNFESSMTGLYFVGALAANSFGPAMRLVSGTGFAAPRLSKRLDQCAWLSLLAGTAD